MRKITFYCDRCGKEIPELVLNLGTRELDVTSGDDYECQREWSAELCKDCYKEIDDMVAFMVKNPTIHFDGGKQIGAEPEKPKKNTGHGKLNLDLGKIAALHNAGWTNQKIVDEMGVSSVTIGNRMAEALEFLANKELQEVRNDE